MQLQEAFPEARGFCGVGVFFANVGDLSPDRERSLLIRKPSCVRGEIRKNERGEQCDEDGDCTLRSCKSVNFSLKALWGVHTSTMKSHLQESRPRALVSCELSASCHSIKLAYPSRLDVMPAAINPENAPDRREPQYRSAVRRASSFRVYHTVKHSMQPG